MQPARRQTFPDDLEQEILPPAGPRPAPWSVPMTHRVFRRVALAAAAALAIVCLAAPADASSSALPRA